MREILFRAKTTDEVRGFKFAPNGTWVYGFYADKVGLPVIYQFEQSRADYVDYEVDRETVGQFTGLTDKNGKQIFENDLCYFFDSNCGEDEVLKVVYEDGGYWLRGDGWDVSFSQINTITDIEVIGNIYDNPELLGGAE